MPKLTLQEANEVRAALKRLTDAEYELLCLHEKYDDREGFIDAFAAGYPFQVSFDELPLVDWRDAFGAELTKITEPPAPPPKESPRNFDLRPVSMSAYGSAIEAAARQPDTRAAALRELGYDPLRFNEPVLRVGQRVVFIRDVERFPHFTVDEGTLGTVSTYDLATGDLHVKVDGDLEGLTDSEDWQGEFQWLPTADPDAAANRRPFLPFYPEAAYSVDGVPTSLGAFLAASATRMTGHDIQAVVQLRIGEAVRIGELGMIRREG